MNRLLCLLCSLDAGGAETFMMKILREWGKDNNCIIDFAVSSSKKGFYEDEAIKIGSRIYHLPMHTKHPLKSFLFLKELVKKNGYKNVIKLCNTPLGVIDLWAAKIGGADRVGIRSCNAITNEKLMMKICNGILRPFMNTICDYKIAPSDLAAEYTFGKKEVGKKKIVYLKNGLDVNVFKFDVQGRKKIRDEFNIEGKYVIGHIGKFSEQKNHKFLIDVFSGVHEKNENAKLMLIGKGSLEKNIQEYVKNKGIADDVIFVGIRDDIPHILSALDVLVLPSLYEGMPNCVIEAQANGLQCYISDRITREADITGNVHYLGIDSCQKWIDCLDNTSKMSREDTKTMLYEHGYDIKSVSKVLEELAFIKI